MEPTKRITDHFAVLQDPRVSRTRLHSLHDILVIALCAVIAGADGWVEVEEFGKAKRKWFAKFLGLEHGIPSHDTFGRVFARLDPAALSKCFTAWVASVAKSLGGMTGKVVAIDGKTLRRSFDKAAVKSATHLVSAFATEARLVLGQIATDQKSNEITAIPKLIELIDITGCIVTIDAMGCQKKIVKQIVNRGADYLIGLKGNQGTLHSEVAEFFSDAAKAGFKDMQHATAETVDGEHGRIETRRCFCTGEVDWFPERRDWVGLRSFGMIESTREFDGKERLERRYFISSLDGTDANRFLATARAHWGIENGLHWILDVSFREDDCRVRKDNAPTNLATLRHLALNLLRNERTAKVGVAIKRHKTGWDNDYLLKVLTAI
jgi:predicted transposase YbfD/YdcC